MCFLKFSLSSQDKQLLIVDLLTFSKSGPSSCGLTQNCGASDAKDNCLSVAENGCDLVTAGAFNVHEVGVGVLHQAFQLVLAFLILWSRVQKVFSELQTK